MLCTSNPYRSLEVVLVRALVCLCGFSRSELLTISTLTTGSFFKEGHPNIHPKNPEPHHGDPAQEGPQFLESPKSLPNIYPTSEPKSHRPAGSYTRRVQELGSRAPSPKSSKRKFNFGVTLLELKVNQPFSGEKRAARHLKP